MNGLVKEVVSRFHRNGYASIEAHGGRIEAESEEGSGTTFRVKLAHSS